MALSTSMRLLYLFVILLIIVGVQLIGYSYLNEMKGGSDKNSWIQKRNEPRMGEKKNFTILLWFAPEWWNWDQRKRKLNTTFDIMMDECCGGCRYTNLKSHFSSADIIVFNVDFIRGNGDFPNTTLRSPTQRYVYWTLENPYRVRNLSSKVGLGRYDSEFNATLTYRNDSTIPMPYGNWKGMDKKGKDPVNSLKRKTKLAVMLASDCKRLGAKLRMKYSDELIDKGLQLDRYGDCFGSRFQGNLGALLGHYKFFMAFENALHCREYITEKFWRTLNLDMVPVVWGPLRSDMKRIAPPNSYVHVEDFNSTKDLVEYLNYLDQNETAYLEYFRWWQLTAYKRSTCDITDSQPFLRRSCGICNYFQNNPEKTSIPSLTNWWFKTEEPECLINSLDELTREQLKKLERAIPNTSLL